MVMSRARFWAISPPGGVATTEQAIRTKMTELLAVAATEVKAGT
jgi:hypothetical protein